jgi:multidrug resistance efflux pump
MDIRRVNAHTVGLVAALTLVMCALACRGDEATPHAAGPARGSAAEAAAPGDASAASNNGDSAEPAGSDGADEAAPEFGAGFTSSADAGFVDVVDGPLEVRRGGLRRTLLLTGELRAVQGHPILVPPTPSWETQIRYVVEDGSFVQAGDRLVELDTGEVASLLNDAETAVQRAISELGSKRAEVDGRLAERLLALDRARIELAKAEIQAGIPEDVQSQRQFEQRGLALEQARVEHEKADAELASYRIASQAELEVLRIDLETAEREVAQAQRAIDTMVLRAPASGIAVVSVNYREGRKFQEGDSAYVGAEILTIPDLSRMMVEARLSDVDDGEVVPGMRSFSTLDAFPEVRLRGAVRSISPVAQEVGYRSMQRYFAVIVDLDESDPERMLPGMSVQVEIETLQLDDTLLVPRAAIEWLDGVPRLLIAGTAETDSVPVELGPCNAFECSLREGPPAGTRLGQR